MDGEENYAEEMQEGESTEELAVSDEELLSVLKAERIAAVGMEDGGELSGQRETALDYIKGEMDDIKSLPGRSKAISTDVADAIETVLPDLMEIFTGGEDVGTFRPDGGEDEERARQETDTILEVFFDDNPGFTVLYDAIKDLLSVKTGIIKTWWDDYEYEEESFSGKTIAEAEAAQADGSEIVAIEPEDEIDPATGMPLVSFTLRNVAKNGCAKIDAVNPANFAVSKDTVLLRDTPYCVERSYPRAFKLLDSGFDPEIVERLPARSAEVEDDSARDTVNESDRAAISHDDLRRSVEIHTHIVRIDMDGDGKTEIWEVITDAMETIVLKKRKRNRVPYAAGTPFRNPHRFFGQSLADKLIEIQRIKTALMRMLLDNGYFSLNQRYEVSENHMSLNTIADLLRNEPGYPVRSQTGQAVRPLTGPGLNFDVTGAIEYISTVAEQRSGVVRNAQGLNSDALHDTKGGMEKLFSAAQRRVRMIARLIAETLIKDAFLNLHGEIRDHCTHEIQIRQGEKWVPVSPASWTARNDMTIELGLGSGGRDAEIASMRELIGMQMQAVQGQASGMIDVPLVTSTQLYNSARRFAERIGMKAPELFFQDPEPIKQQMAQQPPEEPQPSPEEQALQAKLQILAAEKEAKMELAKAEAQFAREMRVLELESEAKIKKYQMDREFELKEAQLARELELKERLEMARIDSQQAMGMHRTAMTSGVHMGGDPG